MSKQTSAKNKGENTPGIIPNILPLGDRVLIKLNDGNEKNKNSFGIIIPDTIGKEKGEQGRIIAVGEGKLNEGGELIPMRVKVGDKVIFSKYGYDEVKVGDEEYLLVSESNILAIIK
jgi:chaperonin GroES